MTPDSVKQVHGVLLKLIKQDDSAFNEKSIWEIRHAGLLGLKYAVAVRKDLVEMLMDGTTDAVILGLCDHDDDVRAVSASTLLPVTAEFVRLSSKERIRKLVDTLWDCLTDLKDDLTASTGAVMDLIAKLFEQQTVMDIVREGHSLGTLVPRLYPFFRHIITNVRVAVLNTLITLLDCKTGNEWVEENVYRLVFQNLIVEERDDVLARTVKAWDVLTSVTHVDHEVILRGTQNWMGSWFEITMTPVGQQLDVATHFYKPPGAFGSGGAQTTDTKASNGKTKAKGTSADDDKGGYNLDAGMILQDFSLVTPEKVMRGRVASATALGKIMSIWPDETMEMSYYEVLIALLSSSWASKRQLAAIVIEEWAKAVMKSRFGVKYHGDGEQIIVLADSISFANRLSKVTVSSLENDGIMQVLPEQQQQQPGLPQGYFYELVFVLKRIRSECQSLLNAFVMEGKVPAGKVPSLPALVVGEVAVGPDSAEGLFSVETAGWVADACFNTLASQLGKVRGKQAIIASLEDRRKRIVTSIGFYDETKQKADTNILATLAGAVVALGVLPAKLNPVIRSVMNSIKVRERSFYVALLK
jgi:TATA-binding protein-associated factor